MTDRTNILLQFSNALSERSAAANSAIAAVRLREGRHITGTLWRRDTLITSEQSLPDREEFELVTAGGAPLKAEKGGGGSRHQPGGCQTRQAPPGRQGHFLGPPHVWGPCRALCGA